MLKPGDTVGPYEVRAFLGEGGMGQVYRAFDPRLERTVALKVIAVHASGDTPESRPNEFSARLLREARAVASLSHPNVVAVYDVGASGSHVYFAMEHVVGATLRVLLAGDAPIAQRLRWLVDVARALEAAHRAGVVHRDVKPENVMVREDGVVKVLDFGIARRTAKTEAQDGTLAAPSSLPFGVAGPLTHAGALVGTPFYMAPEQITGKDVNPRCDQFAWAVMAYELLARERPWSDEGNLLAVVARILIEPPSPLRARAPEVPLAVEDILVRALSKEPKARFPTMKDVADALEPFASAGDRVRVLASLPPSADPTAFAATMRIGLDEPSPTPPAVPAPRPRRRALDLAVPLVLLGALAAVVVVVRREPPGPTPPPPRQEEPDAARTSTTVPEAESAYRRALAAFREGAGARARGLLAQAISRDRSFAAAHLELAMSVAANLPADGVDDSDGFEQSLRRAFASRERLVARDAALLDASEPILRTPADLDEWETRLASVALSYPEDAPIRFHLGRARERRGDDEGARTAYESALAIDGAFVPAAAALAGVSGNLGRVQEALGAADRCVDRWPLAPACFETRFRILSRIRECKRAQQDADAWRRLEPESARALGTFARALYAGGAPLPSVEEAFRHRWAVLPAELKPRAEQWDRMKLAIARGDLEPAEQLAKAYEDSLSPRANVSEHQVPALLRVGLLLEVNRPADAAAVARDFLDRHDAWSSSPFAVDASVLFAGLVQRSGALAKESLDRRRPFLEGEQRRVSLNAEPASTQWMEWAYAWGWLSETSDEAREALSHLPELALPPVVRRARIVDFALGKAYALGGRPTQAIAALTDFLESCADLDDALVIARTHYFLGVAYETKGDVPQARASYQSAIDGWPKGTSFRTARQASLRLAALLR